MRAHNPTWRCAHARRYVPFLMFTIASVSCGGGEAPRASRCDTDEIASPTIGTPDRFVRPTYVPAGFDVEVFEDRGPRRVVLTGKAISGVVPAVDLQLLAIDPGAEILTSPEIRQDGAGKFSAKWNIDDRTVLATAAFAPRDEFDKVLRSITLVDTAQLCAFIREHNGRLFEAVPATSQ
jgi:hypothetical protein